MASFESRLFLHDHPVSSYAQKVRMALRQKGIPFDLKTPEGLGSGNPVPGLQEANPRLEVPALEDGDFKIFDSKVILAYLEEKYPEKPLLPKDVKARAEARMIEEMCDTHYEAINWGIGEIKFMERATGELAEKLMSQAKAQTEEIHKWLSVKLGTNDFFHGSSVSYADICVAPYMNRSFIFGLGPAEGTALQQWRARVMEIPSIKQTYDEMEAGAQKMAGLKGVFKPGGGYRREYRDHRLEWMVKSGGIEVVEQGLIDGTLRFSWPPGGVSSI